MTGVVLLVVVLVVVIPVGTLLLGALAAAVLGTSLRRGQEAEHAGSELVDLNR
ncbi:MAG TPA: hypothetical protein VF640_07635 [Acidimicrobiales bacterium]